jgi:hypothetical protein
VIEQVAADAASTETFKEENPEWADGWQPAALVSPSPYSTPPVPSANLSDEALDAEIDKLLASPEIDAMLENVANDAADDIGEAVQEVIDAASADKAAEYQYPLQNPNGVIAIGRTEFEEFKDRVIKAFKHAGFKF